jgi:hypothetical protein
LPIRIAISFLAILVEKEIDMQMMTQPYYKHFVRKQTFLLMLRILAMNLLSKNNDQALLNLF